LNTAYAWATKETGYVKFHRFPSDTQTYAAAPINVALNYVVFLKRQSVATRRR